MAYIGDVRKTEVVISGLLFLGSFGFAELAVAGLDLYPVLFVLLGSFG